MSKQKLKTRNPARDALLSAGWQIVRHKNHLVLRCPCGKHTQSCAVSTSDHRSTLNVVSRIKQCQEGR